MVLLLLTFCLLLLPLWESVIVLCFVVRYFMSILVLQSSWWGRESWLLCLICLPGVPWWMSGSSSRCHRVVCGLWLWYFLIILTYYFYTAFSIVWWCVTHTVWMQLANWYLRYTPLKCVDDEDHKDVWKTPDNCHTKSKQGCKDQESIQSSTTPDPGYQWESDKLTVRHHKGEPRGHPFPSRWPQRAFKQTHTKT